MREKERKREPVAKRHHMVSGTLAPLYTIVGLKLGCIGAAAQKERKREKERERKKIGKKCLRAQFLKLRT